MAKLQHALAWAKRGYPVFPLAPDSRTPAWSDWDWRVGATTDAATIEAWWGAGEWNIGCRTGNGLVVVDLDVKHKGQNGIASYMALDGDTNTLAVRTTTGGMHLYFAGEGRNSQAKIGAGIDTRGDGGYVVAPGSTINGRAYEVVADRPLARLPASIAEAMVRRASVAANTPLTELDTTAILAAARHWLDTASPAIQGQGGDAHTFQVACELRDRGVSEGLALDLLLEGWNEQCSPPWEAEALQEKVRNAYAYAQNPAGAKAAEVLLGTGTSAVSIPEDTGPREISPAPEEDYSAWKLGSFTPLGELPARPWVYRRFLMRGEITVLAGAGASGKSLLTLTAAIYLALGRDFHGYKLATPGQPGNSVIYDAEDKHDEMMRRLYAACQALDVEPRQVEPHIALVSGKDPRSGRPKLVRLDGGVPKPDIKSINLLLNKCHHQNVAMLGIGPLVKMHSGLNENDNAHMDMMMDALTEVAVQGNLALLLSHHIAKPGAAGTDAYVGNVDSIRGASNIVNSARFAFTLAAPTQEDASRMNLTRDQRSRLVRFDETEKMNMALRSGEPVWIAKRTVLLPNGDEVGAFVPADMSAATEANRQQMAHRLHLEMESRGLASMSLTEAAAILQDMDPLYSKLTARQVKVRLEAFFAEDAALPGGGALRLTPGEKRMITFVDA